MGDSNSKSSHSDCLKQAKALVFWHLGLGSPQKQSLGCRPVIWEIISENKSEAGRWRGGKSVQGYSVGTGGSIPEKRQLSSRIIPLKGGGWSTCQLVYTSHYSKIHLPPFFNHA